MRWGGLPEQLSCRGVESAPHCGDGHGAVRHRPRLQVAVRVGGVDAALVDARAPLETAGGAAWPGGRDPYDLAGTGVERPVLAALLAGADEVARLAVSSRLD